MNLAANLISAGDLTSIAPEIVLAAAGVFILLVDAFLPKLKRSATLLSLLAVAVAGYLAWTSLPVGPSFGGLLLTDGVSRFAIQIVFVASFLALLASHSYLRREHIFSGEYHALILWCLVGLTLMLRAAELLTLFVSLELLSICLYALAGYHRRKALATESAIKYFLMGAFVSAFVLYGIALLYGVTGTTKLDAIATALAHSAVGPELPAMATFGFLLLMAGFAFKMSLAPFHSWAPDVYQGAPSPFVAFLAVAPKVASVLVIVHLLQAVQPSGAGADWSNLISLLAVLSMLIGNLLALAQREIKRMLAYSGVSHMGFVLIPLADLGTDSWVPVLTYLLAYALMNAGAFVVVSLLYSGAGEQHLISELSGWGYRYPLLGLCLTICMLSLGGIPPTAGFMGKYLVFVHAVEHGNLGLAAVGLFASLVGIVYYLRVVHTLYMKSEVAAPAGLLIDSWGRAAAVIAAAGTLLIGVWPGPLLDWLFQAATYLY